MISDTQKILVQIQVAEVYSRINDVIDDTICLENIAEELEKDFDSQMFPHRIANRRGIRGDECKLRRIQRGTGRGTGLHTQHESCYAGLSEWRLKHPDGDVGSMPELAKIAQEGCASCQSGWRK